MDDQALLEGIVVFSDEDGPGNISRRGQCGSVLPLQLLGGIWHVRGLPLFLSLRWSVSRTVLMERLLMTLPGVTYGSVSGSMLG